MKPSNACILAALALGASSSVSVADELLYGTVIAHNGTGGSGTAPEGSGDVAVRFQYGMFTCGPHHAVYDEPATHEVAFAYAPGPATNMWNRSYIYNSSDVAWSGFVIRLEGADFGGGRYGNAEQARAADPVVDGNDPWDSDEIALYNFFGYDFSLLDSQITRFNPEGSEFADAELTVWFDDPVADGWAFALDYNVIPSPGATTPSEFTIYLTPIPVPEPATFSLLTLGALAFLRRKRQAGKITQT